MELVTILLQLMLLVFGTSSELITITETSKACPARTTTTTSTSTLTVRPGSASASIWSTQGASATPSANGGPTLVPGPAPSNNPGDFENLTPNTTGTMYYCAGTTLDSCSEMMVQLNATFLFPTVILEHSAYISRVEWSESILTIVFNSPGAYNFIKTSWNLPEASLVPRDLTTPFVLASTAQPSTGNQRDYFLVNKVHYDDGDLEVVCYGADLDLEGAIDDLGIQWGSYTNGGNPTASQPGPSTTLSGFVNATTPAPQTSRPTFLSVIPASTAVTTQAISSPYPTFVVINSTSESSTIYVRTPPPQTITYTSVLTLTEVSSAVSTITVTSQSIGSITVIQPTTLLATTTLSAGDPVTLTSTVLSSVVQPTTIDMPTTLTETTTLPDGSPSTYTSVYTTSIVETTTIEVPSTVLVTSTISSEVTSVYTSTYSTTLVQPTTVTETSLVSTQIEVTNTATSVSTFTSTITPEPMTITSVQTVSTSILVVSTVSASTFTTTMPPQTVTITSTRDACGSYPSATTSGMPAATCGSDFDRRLDEQYGYYDFSANNGTELNDFAPGAGLTQQDVGYSPGSSNGTLSQRDLHLLRKRGFFSFINKVVKSVASVVKTVTNAAVNVTKNIPIVSNVVQSVAKSVNTIVNVATTAVSLVTNQPTTAEAKFTLPIGVKAPNNDESPWGPAYKIFECGESCGSKKEANKQTVADLWKKNALLPALDALGVIEEPEPGIRVYCVNCGVDGSFSVSGSITVQLTSGVKSAQVSLAGNLHAGVSLGVEFLAIYEREIGRYRLLEVGVPGFSIPGVITIGPQVTLDIAATLSIEAQGQAIAGFHYYLTGFQQTIDFIDKSKSKSTGWTPRVEHVFNAMGSLSATAQLGLPVGIVVGVSLLGGKYSLTAGVVDTPSIDFTASYSISADLDGVTVNDGRCNGIEWYIDLRNKIQAVYPGNTLLIGQWNGPTLAKGCLGAKPKQTPPPVVTRRTTTTTTTTNRSSSTRASSTSTLASTTVSFSPYTLTPCTPVISNGDFGDSMPQVSQYVSPWQIATYPSDVSNPWTIGSGYQSSKGLVGNVLSSLTSSYSGIIVSQNVTMVPGANYSLSMTFKYGRQTSSCYLNGFLDGIYIWSIYDGNMPQSVGNWVDNTAPVFTASKTNAVFSIYFTCVAGQSNTYYLDNVRFNLVGLPAGTPTCTSSVSSSRTSSAIITTASWPTRGLGCPNPTPTAFTRSSTIFQYEWCMAYLSPGSVNMSPGSLAGCAALCTGSCVAFNYADSNNCRTMSSVQAISTSFYAWSAYSLVGIVTPTPSAISSPSIRPATTTTTTTTTATGASTSSSVPTLDVACGGYGNQTTYIGADGSTYLVQCGTDYNPGSAGDRAYKYATFKQCIDACVTAGTSCYAASFVPSWASQASNCYLKGSSFYKQTVSTEVWSVLRLSGPRAVAMKRQAGGNGTTSGNSTAGDLIAIADASVDFAGSSFDAQAAAAAEAAFQIVDVTNSTSLNSSSGFDLPPLNDTLAASANATLELVALVNSNDGSNASSDAALDTSIGTSWTTLYDTTRTVMLSAADDGNLYLAGYINITTDNPQTAVLFSSASAIVSSDYQSRLFVYFPASIANYNVSRLRLVEDPYIPRGSRVVTLTPLQIGSQSIYVAMDTEGNGYQLAWCTMQGANPKVFIVGDPDRGPANLMKEELRWSVTGGITGNCSTLALSSDEEGFDVGAS